MSRMLTCPGPVTASHRRSGEMARRSEEVLDIRGKASCSVPVATSQILTFCMATAATRRPSGVKATLLTMSWRGAPPGFSSAMEWQHRAPARRILGHVIQPHLALTAIVLSIDLRPGSGQGSSIGRIGHRLNPELLGLRFQHRAQVVARHVPELEGKPSPDRQGLAVRCEYATDRTHPWFPSIRAVSRPLDRSQNRTVLSSPPGSDSCRRTKKQARRSARGVTA